MELLIFIFSSIALLSFMVFWLLIFDKNNSYGYPLIKNRNKSNIITASILLLSLCSLFLAYSLIHANNFIENANNDFTKVGPYGDLIGGILNPVVAFIGIIAASLAFYAQYNANKKIQEQFSVQQATEHFYKMLDIHNSNIKEFKIASYYKSEDSISEKTVTSNKVADIYRPKKETTTIRIEKEFTLGRRCFLLMLKDFHFILWNVNKRNSRFKGTNKELSPELLLQVAYRIFFWGTKTNHIYPKGKEELTKNEIEAIDDINISMHSIRTKIRDTQKGDLITNSYKVENEKTVENNFRFIPMSGHSSRLAHYYRHLYQTAKHIHYNSQYQRNEFLAENKIDFRFRTLRAQMSNEEQLLLYYNYRFGFGGRWDFRYDNPKQGTQEFRFLTKYKMLHNIPLFDTIHHLVEHPNNHFKDYTNKYPMADLFEWNL